MASQLSPQQLRRQKRRQKRRQQVPLSVSEKYTTSATKFVSYGCQVLNQQVPATPLIVGLASGNPFMDDDCYIFSVEGSTYLPSTYSLPTTNTPSSSSNSPIVMFTCSVYGNSTDPTPISVAYNYNTIDGTYKTGTDLKPLSAFFDATSKYFILPCTFWPTHAKGNSLTCVFTLRRKNDGNNYAVYNFNSAGADGTSMFESGDSSSHAC